MPILQAFDSRFGFWRRISMPVCIQLRLNRVCFRRRVPILQELTVLVLIYIPNLLGTNTSQPKADK